MATQGGGGTADVYATVWDLAEGFAVLARTCAPTNRSRAEDLLVVVNRMRARAAAIEREELADRLQAAANVLENRLG